MIFQQMKLREQVYKVYIPMQQASTPLITLSGSRIRKQNSEAMRKDTEDILTTLLTLLSLSLFASHIPVWIWFYHV